MPDLEDVAAAEQDSWSVPQPPDHPDVRGQVEQANRLYGPEFDSTPLHVTLLMYRLISVLERAHAIELSPLGVSGSQFNVLTVLHRSSGPMTMGSVARAVSALPPNLTAVVNSLSALGYVAREPNPADRRSSLLRITEKGRELIAGFMPGHWNFLGELFAGLDRDARAQLAELLTRLLMASEERCEDRAPELAERVVLAAKHAWSQGSGDGSAVTAARGRRPATRFAGP